MEPDMKEHLKSAIGNFTRFGDTDIFPYPIERYVFYDLFDEALKLFEEIHGDFGGSLSKYPVIQDGSLVAVNYFGYRWATQIDPIWNTYLLALVISIGQEIEAARIPVDRKVIYSYRFSPNPDSHLLFEPDSGWRQFQERSLELSQDAGYVLVCDISDFYPRVYHHSLENALDRATKNKEAIRRIMIILGTLSARRSYGLPVGGPAARLLGELVLNGVDRLLLAEGITFCRFVDDYHFFANSEEEAYCQLILLNEKLLRNEGLSLQKAKTRLMTASEFRTTSELSSEYISGDRAEDRGFFSLRIHYDPYSETADEDYQSAKEAVNQYNIHEILLKELAKGRVQRLRASQIVRHIRYMREPGRSPSVLTLLDNFQKLYPVFPLVMITLKEVVVELDEASRLRVFDALRELARKGAHIIQIPINLAYLVRVLSHDKSVETDQVLNQIYRSSSSMMLRRDVILAMARRKADFWIREEKNNFATLNLWERRAMVIASYVLGDEGKFFRNHIKNDLSPFDQIVRDWAADKKKISGRLELPL